MRLVLLLMWLLHWLPLPVLGRIGEAVGSLLFVAMRSRRKITLINLKLCMPEKSDAKRKEIAKKHFQAYARSILERGILWWAPFSRIRRLIVVEPRVPIDVIESGPVIFLCPHFVCLDVPGIAVVQQDKLVCSIYMRQRNKVFDDALLRGRNRFGPVKIFSRSDGVKPIIRAMREGLPYIMLPDQDFGLKNAEFVDFFGIKAATLTALPRIAAATNAKVIPVIGTFLPNYQGWKVEFFPPWENYPGDDMVAATRQMNAFIEERIRENPAEYIWTHKRFKTRPPGMPSVYVDHVAEKTES
jgi:KDO2-lipid IV(A) lauroyltransferase